MSTATTTAPKSGCGCGASKKSGSTGGCGCGGSGGCGGACGCASGSIVRPAFFAGQLLTDDDLQTLTAYVITKDRLRNRMLFGTGVVCGLQVRCAACGGGKVTVQPGYAIDCCGRDISVECPETRDIMEMLRKLKVRIRGDDCGDPCPPAPGKEPDEEADPKKPDLRRYDLVIKYHEDKTDAVAPYQTDDPCGPGHCEFTRIKEGYCFELRCAAPCEEYRGLADALDECGQQLSEPVVEETTKPATGDIAANPMVNLESNASKSSVDAVVDYRDRLLTLVEASAGIVRCDLADRIRSVVIPGVDAKAAGPVKATLLSASLTELSNAVGALKELADEFKLACACEVLLPPCDHCDDDALVLARITVDESACIVKSICNLVRRQIVTAPALRYWTDGWLGLGNAITEYCCDCGCQDNDNFMSSLLHSIVAPSHAANATAAEKMKQKVTMFQTAFKSSTLRRAGNVDRPTILKPVEGEEPKPAPVFAPNQRAPSPHPAK